MSSSSENLDHGIIDGVRGLAGLVLLMHNLYFGPTDGRVAYGVWRLSRSGWIGVDGFLVVTGLLVTRVLLGTRGAPHYYRTFYVRRLLRVAPLYYAFLAIWLAVAAHVGNFSESEIRALHDQQWWYWAFLVNVHLARHSPPSGAYPTVFWSLAIQVHFYLVWPFVVALTDRRRLGGVCLGMIAGAILVRTAWRLLAPGPIATEAVYTLTAARMDDLGIGALIAIWLTDPGRWPWVRRWARPAALSLTALLGGILFAHRGLRLDRLFFQTIGYTLVGLTIGAYLVALLAPGSWLALRRGLTAAPLRFVGRYSFGICLWHAGLFYPLFRAHPPPVLGSPVVGALVSWCAVTGAAIALGAATQRAYDGFVAGLRQRFPYAYERRGVRVTPPLSRAP